MSRYNKYKPGSIQWFGDIPFHWVERKFKQVAYMKGRIGWQGLKNEEFTFEPDQPFLITGMNFKDGAIDWSDIYHISDERYQEAPEIQLKEGDVLMTKDGTIGKLLFIDEIPFPHKASLNSHLLVFRPYYKEFYPKFLYYQLQSEPFFHHIELTKTGTTFFGITQEAVGTYKLILPPLEEQINIANHLDQQTHKIDQLITNKKKQAEKLKELRQIEINNAVTKGLNPHAKMKHSGIDWLGEINEKYKLDTFKRVCRLKQGLQIDQELRFFEKGTNRLPYITIKAINAEAEAENIEYIESADEGVICSPDEILLSRTGATGEVVTGLHGVFHNNFFKIIYNRSLLDKEFLVFYLNNSAIKSYLLLLAGTTTIPDLNHRAFFSAPIVLPEMTEQKKIARHLKLRIKTLDQLTTNIDAQIEKLQELRKIELYEAVTGKVKVNSYAETTA